jgi:hypothetical protein
MDATHPVYDRPHVIQKEIEVKPNETVDVHFEFPVRKVTIEYVLSRQSCLAEEKQKRGP